MTHKVYQAVDPELTAEAQQFLSAYTPPGTGAMYDYIWQRLVTLQGATLAKGDEVRFVDGKIEVDRP